MLPATDPTAFQSCGVSGPQANRLDCPVLVASSNAPGSSCWWRGRRIAKTAATSANDGPVSGTRREADVFEMPRLSTDLGTPRGDRFSAGSASGGLSGGSALSFGLSPVHQPPA